MEFADINSVYIDDDVKIGKGTFIGPCVTLEKGSIIGENCRILQNTRIIEHRIAELVEKKILTENEASSVDVECINGFFRSEPEIRAVRAARKGLLVKEQPFNLMSERGGERIIIQGIPHGVGHRDAGLGAVGVEPGAQLALLGAGQAGDGARLVGALADEGEG